MMVLQARLFARTGCKVFIGMREVRYRDHMVLKILIAKLIISCVKLKRMSAC